MKTASLAITRTWLLTNLDDALRNSEYWENATEFDPQNFLDEHGKYKKNNDFMPFGVGKCSVIKAFENLKLVRNQ